MGAPRLLGLPTAHTRFSFTQTVRPWHEGDKLWVSWTQTFSINMTKELLKKINFHKITLRLWDTKDKVSRKVRYYRLKTAGYAEAAGPCGKSGFCVLVEKVLEAAASHQGQNKGQHPLVSLSNSPAPTLVFLSVGCHPSRMHSGLGQGCWVTHLPSPASEPPVPPGRCQHGHTPPACLLDKCCVSTTTSNNKRIPGTKRGNI